MLAGGRVLRVSPRLPCRGCAAAPVTGLHHPSTPARCLHTTATCCRKRPTGKYKVTQYRTKPLTYEMAQPPELIGVTKAWNSWNTSPLLEDRDTDLSKCLNQEGKVAVEDMFIRKFMFGTWHNLFVSEVIIKRRHNLIIIAGLIHRMILPRKVYFLTGYTEELLSCLLKCPVKVEVQTVESRQEMVFKYI